jgi:hypothetical protein
VFDLFPPLKVQISLAEGVMMGYSPSSESQNTMFQSSVFIPANNVAQVYKKSNRKLEFLHSVVLLTVTAVTEHLKVGGVSPVSTEKDFVDMV